MLTTLLVFASCGRAYLVFSAVYLAVPCWASHVHTFCPVQRFRIAALRGFAHLLLARRWELPGRLLAVARWARKVLALAL